MRCDIQPHLLDDIHYSCQVSSACAKISCSPDGGRKQVTVVNE